MCLKLVENPRLNNFKAGRLDGGAAAAMLAGLAGFQTGQIKNGGRKLAPCLTDDLLDRQCMPILCSEFSLD